MANRRFTDFALRAPLSSRLALACLAFASTAVAAESTPGWELADRRGQGDEAVALFVEQAPVPGRPTFRLETSFDVPPAFARSVLLEDMVDPSRAPSGQRRKVLERTANGAVVYTFIDLPLMLADRELVLRVEESHDPATGVHRIEWAEANELLPPAGEDVVRLTGAAGYWEFRPDGQGGTQAIHETRTELGGSIPVSLGDRMMKSQAIESVEGLRARIEERGPGAVAAGPPK
ncbi:MAG: hypothetical protein IPK00_13660 [Deltaproteobacteria bacterium]|nr:hypothetical protein [Deltaproteobacteria bacterium]